MEWSTFKTEEERKQFIETVTAMTPLGQRGEPEEIAKAAIFLASEDSSFINGIELFVDGGICANIIHQKALSLYSELNYVTAREFSCFFFEKWNTLQLNLKSHTLSVTGELTFI